MPGLSLDFLYPSQSSWHSWSHVALWLLLLLPAWSRLRSDPVFWNSQSRQSSYQLCLLISCIVCVIAFLIAHKNDVYARFKGSDWISLACPKMWDPYDVFCTTVRCRTLGWLSKPVNADFGQFGSSSVASRGSVWLLAHASSHRRFLAFEGSG